MGGIAVRGKTGVDVLAFLIREELGSVRVVVDEPVGCDSYDDCGNTLEDENPAPTVLPNGAAHKADAIGQDTTEGSGKSSGSEEERYTKLSLAPLVPHGEVVDYSGEETTLGNTEEETGDKEASEVLDDTHQGGYDTP